MYHNALPNTLFEMLRSFVTVAETLNVAKATKELNLTRQTIVRHISELQKIRGHELFDRSSKTYELTNEGQEAFTEAKSLLRSTRDWLNSPRHVHAEFTREIFNGEDDYLLVQDHPIIDVWHLAPELLQEGLKAWVESRGQLDHPALDAIRSHLILFREHPDGWICIEVGDKSSIMDWLGWKWAKSAIGTLLDTIPVASGNGRLMTDAYQQASQTGGVCYEHVCSRLPHPENREPVNVNYQRLIFSCLLPNKDKILASLAIRTNSILINKIDPEKIPKMPEKYSMDNKK